MHTTTNIIDNLDNNIWEHIRNNLSKSEAVKFAVGYLFLSWLKDIHKELKDLNEIKLIIWTKTNKSTSNFLQNLIETKENQTPAEKEDIKKETKKDYKNDIWEEFKQTQDDKNFLNTLYELVKDENKFQIKIYTKWTFHAKAYIFGAKQDSMTKWQCIVGSSNLSKSWFYDNTELNVIVDWNENYDKITNWFDRLWEESVDFNQDLLDIIDNSWLKLEPTPYEIYMKVLYELVWDYVENKYWNHDWMDTLFQFQIDAVYQAVWIVQKYWWVFLSDVVWLWKTYTWSIILHILTKQSHTKWLVIAPAWLIENWEDALNKFQINAKVISQDSLDKVIKDKHYDKFQYVLVDESHKFKDKNSNRYVKLQEFIHKTNKKLILLSATPLNLNGWDIYNQIKLFHKWDETELPITPSHLYQFFKEYEKWNADISDIMKELMVRRTRIQIKRDYEEDLKKHNLSFPQRIWPEIINYDISEEYQGIYKEIEKTLWKRSPYGKLKAKEKKEIKENLTEQEIKEREWFLNYAMYFKTKYLKADSFTLDKDWNKKLDDSEFDDLIWVWDNLKELAKITFFLRIESSPKAFIETIKRILDYNRIFLKNLEKWFVLKTKHSDELKKIDSFDDENDDYLNILEGNSYSWYKFDIEKYKKDIKEDIKLLEHLQTKSSILEKLENKKIAELQKILDKHKKEKIIIFTQYTDTAEYLWEALSNYRNIWVLSWKNKSQLTNILWKFAPKAQDYKIEDEEFDILIATDVIAEWQNIQDASVVINYDLHWNPVRLIQRIWRIDRIWSENDYIYIYNFSSSNLWEEKVWIQWKVSERIWEIHKHIWEENKILTEDEKLNKKLLKLFEDIQNWKKDKFEELESLTEESNELFTYSSFIKELRDLKNNDNKLFNKIKKLPLRVRTAKKWDDKHTLVFCKHWIYEYFYLQDKKWDIINNKTKFLKLLKSSKDDSLLKLPQNHDEITNNIENKFYEDIKEKEKYDNIQLESKIDPDMATLKNKILEYQKTLSKYEEELQDKCDDITSFLSNKLEAYQKRKFKQFKNHKKPENFNETIINEMIEVIDNIKDISSTKSNKKQNSKKLIVISESIV